MKRYLEDGIREEQTLFFAILFGLLSFLSLLPALAKHAFLTNESLSALAAAQFISSVFMMPLLMYGIAAVSHLILKYFAIPNADCHSDPLIKSHYKDDEIALKVDNL